LAGVALLSTTALASTFTFSNTTVTYTLTYAWGSAYDSGKANTAWAGISGYSVTTYLEGVDNNGNRVGTSPAFNYGATTSPVQKDDCNVWAFNSSHSVANSSNVYSALNTKKKSAW
jgi:hypothetical protein